MLTRTRSADAFESLRGSLTAFCQSSRSNLHRQSSHELCRSTSLMMPERERELREIREAKSLDSKTMGSPRQRCALMDSRSQIFDPLPSARSRSPSNESSIPPWVCQATTGSPTQSKTDILNGRDAYVKTSGVGPSDFLTRRGLGDCSPRNNTRTADPESTPRTRAFSKNSHRHLEQSSTQEYDKLSSSRKSEVFKASSQYCLCLDIDQSMKRAAGEFSPRSSKQERSPRASQRSPRASQNSSLADRFAGLLPSDKDRINKSVFSPRRSSAMAILEDFDTPVKTNIEGHRLKDDTRAAEEERLIRMIRAAETNVQRTLEAEIEILRAKHASGKFIVPEFRGIEKSAVGRRRSVASASTACSSPACSSPRGTGDASSDSSGASFQRTYVTRNEARPWSPPPGKPASRYFSEIQSLAIDVDKFAGGASPRGVQRQFSQLTIPRVSAADMRAYVAQSVQAQLPMPSPRSPRNIGKSKPTLREKTYRPPARQGSKTSAISDASTCVPES